MDNEGTGGALHFDPALPTFGGTFPSFLWGWQMQHAAAVCYLIYFQIKESHRGAGVLGRSAKPLKKIKFDWEAPRFPPTNKRDEKGAHLNETTDAGKFRTTQVKYRAERAVDS